MSDLGAIFHVKKDGVQYDAHAYTTVEECPEPNLKINFKGTTGYVKLSEEENNPDATPIRVHVNSSGKTLKVLKVAGAPTGSITINGMGEFTVPAGVTVIQVSHTGLGFVNVGVTPNTKHSLSLNWIRFHPRNYLICIRCNSHDVLYIKDEIIADSGAPELSSDFNVDWSPDINKLTPTVTDYN